MWRVDQIVAASQLLFLFELLDQEADDRALWMPQNQPRSDLLVDRVEVQLAPQTPVIAPSGFVIYQGNLFPAWKGNAFIGGLVTRTLVRLELDGEKVTKEERLLNSLNERIRDVREGPDGAIYLLTDNAAGRILRLTPAK